MDRIGGNKMDYKIKIEFEIVNADDDTTHERDIEAIGILNEIALEIARTGLNTLYKLPIQKIDSINHTGYNAGQWEVQFKEYNKENLSKTSIPILIDILNELDHNNTLEGIIEERLSIEEYRNLIIENILSVQNQEWE